MSLNFRKKNDFLHKSEKNSIKISFFFLLSRIQGQYQYDPNINKTTRRLYRTNPSIPRPESKYGAKSSIYEQIIEIKRQTTDSTGKKLKNIKNMTLIT